MRCILTALGLLLSFVLNASDFDGSSKEKYLIKIPESLFREFMLFMGKTSEQQPLGMVLTL